MSDALDAPEDHPDGIHPALDERCKHEMLVDQCAHCRSWPASRNPPDPFGDPAPASTHWFRANYRGYCSQCGERFEEGEVITFDLTIDGGYLGPCCGSGP